MQVFESETLTELLVHASEAPMGYAAVHMRILMLSALLMLVAVKAAPFEDMLRGAFVGCPLTVGVCLTNTADIIYAQGALRRTKPDSGATMAGPLSMGDFCKSSCRL